MATSTEVQTKTPEAPVVDETSAENSERIQKRAYELYEARGREGGHDLEDWLQAEAEIIPGITPVTER